MVLIVWGFLPPFGHHRELFVTLSFFAELSSEVLHSLFVNSCGLQWFFFQEMFFFWTAMHFKRMLWISLLQIYLLQEELWRSIGRLFLQCIWEWYEMPYKHEHLQKAEVIQEIYFYCTISCGVPWQICFVRAWLDMQSCLIFVVMERSICFPELLLLFPVSERFRDTNLKIAVLCPWPCPGHGNENTGIQSGTASEVSCLQA